MLRSRGIDEDLGTHFLTLELIEGADFGIAKATNLPGSIQSGALKGKVPYVN
jgi:hypothetical protein